MMVYPTAAELQACRIYATGEDVLCRKYNLTLMEMHDLQTYGRVRESTATWADGLRAKYGELTHA